MAGLRFFLGLIVAALVQTLGLRLFSPFWWIDPFLLLVVATARASSPAASLAAGSVTGLVQDALTGGLYGLHGFANTVAAWAVSRIQQRLVIHQPLQVAWLFALAATLQQALLVVLSFVMVPGTALPGAAEILIKIATSGLLGATLVMAARQLRGWQADWRAERRQRLRLDLR